MEYEGSHVRARRKPEPGMRGDRPVVGRPHPIANPRRGGAAGIRASGVGPRAERHGGVRRFGAAAEAILAGMDRVVRPVQAVGRRMLRVFPHPPQRHPENPGRGRLPVDRRRQLLLRRAAGLVRDRSPGEANGPQTRALVLLDRRGGSVGAEAGGYQALRPHPRAGVADLRRAARPRAGQRPAGRRSGVHAAGHPASAAAGLEGRRHDRHQHEPARRGAQSRGARGRARADPPCAGDDGIGDRAHAATAISTRSGRCTKNSRRRGGCCSCRAT